MRVAREEIFGPVLSVIAVDGIEEAIDIANDVEFGLTSSIYTRDVNQVFRYIDRIETGMLHVNSPTIGGEAQLPFGGMKKTGIGPREMGKTAIEFFTEWKTVYIDYTGSLRGGNLY
jgi:aldehyde dehydrogenase (NAD+)